MTIAVIVILKRERNLLLNYALGFGEFNIRRSMSPWKLKFLGEIKFVKTFIENVSNPSLTLNP